MYSTHKSSQNLAATPAGSSHIFSCLEFHEESYLNVSRINHSLASGIIPRNGTLRNVWRLLTQRCTFVLSVPGDWAIPLLLIGIGFWESREGDHQIMAVVINRGGPGSGGGWTPDCPNCTTGGTEMEKSANLKSNQVPRHNHSSLFSSIKWTIHGLPEARESWDTKYGTMRYV